MKILIVGLGSIGKKHVEGILNLYPFAEIFALRSSKNQVKFRSVINIYSLSEVPQDLTFIVISNISSKHVDSIISFIDFNCPLFIEKPVLINLNSAVKISSLLKKFDIMTYVACNMRFHPSIEYLYKYFSNNTIKINEVNVYCGSYLPEWRPNVDFRNVYSSNKSMGGGVHLDLIHEMDYICWLLGFPISVLSMHSCASSLEIDSIDSARYLLKYQDFSASITLNYYRLVPKRQIEIITSDDIILVDLLTNKITSELSGKPIFQSEFDMSDTYTKQIKYFTDKVFKGELPMNNFDEAVEILKLAL